jgi:beta-aspartyl-peptidase (threonine type)
MKKRLHIILIVLISCIFSLNMNSQNLNEIHTNVFDDEDIVMIIHGGAGYVVKGDMTKEKENEYMTAMTAALQSGYTILKSGGSSMDAVQAAIVYMEDSPLFNAGKGAVFTADGKNELDASIVSGDGMHAGAVAGVTTIKNPIKAARAVISETHHVMLAREGAEAFAKKVGLDIVDPSYFYTENAWKELQSVKKNELDSLKKHHGTVGAVALDQHHELAAATSTGGLTNKRYGRIGDSPIIGAGTYAENNYAGVSCTGVGEYFIRNVTAYDLIAQMKYQNKSVQDAAYSAIDKIRAKGGIGGLIALDAKGHATSVFNTPGMFRGVITKSGKVSIYFYR